MPPTSRRRTTPASPAELDAARQLLGVPPSADQATLRRAWRTRARSAHPDRGGDARQFQLLQEAYETLAAHLMPPPPAHGAAATTASRGRPSRQRSATPAITDVDWSQPPVAVGQALTRDGTAVLIGRHGHGSLRATSRSPGSRLNRLALHLGDTAAAEVMIGQGRDPHGHLTTVVVVKAGRRTARKALDRLVLPTTWIRRRTPSFTTLSWHLPADLPDDTAVGGVVVDALATVLTAADWPLQQWYRAR